MPPRGRAKAALERPPSHSPPARTRRWVPAATRGSTCLGAVLRAGCPATTFQVLQGIVPGLLQTVPRAGRWRGLTSHCIHMGCLDSVVWQKLLADFTNLREGMHPQRCRAPLRRPQLRRRQGRRQSRKPSVRPPPSRPLPTASTKEAPSARGKAARVPGSTSPTRYQKLGRRLLHQAAARHITVRPFHHAVQGTETRSSGPEVAPRRVTAASLHHHHHPPGGHPAPLRSSPEG